MARYERSMIEPRVSAPVPTSSRGVVLVLFAGAVAGTLVSLALATGAAQLLDASAMFGFGATVLFGVSVSWRLRAGWRPAPPTGLTFVPPRRGPVEQSYLRGVQQFAGVVSLGLVALATFLWSRTSSRSTSLFVATIAVAVFGVIGSVLVARYFGGRVDRDNPEDRLLSSLGRVGGWGFSLVLLTLTLKRVGISTPAVVVHVITLVIVGLSSLELALRSVGSVFGEGSRTLHLFGSRANVVASVLDGIEQTGIDLRSTWALAYLRRRLMPLIVGLTILGWLSTSISIIGRDERALVERLGVVSDAEALQPGFHLHLPWPIDRVLRTEVNHVRSVAIGHEAEEAGGPENVLWAREHAVKEYTLLVGDGHDLLTVDAKLQFRIVDARAWTYVMQNPTDALRASAYRAVMRATVNRTLDSVLSENVARLTAQIRADIQADADALGVGVEIVGFTVGGMHPPVPVARDYEAVVSAEVGKTTTVVDARAARNRTVPAAEIEVLEKVNRARSDAEEERADAAGAAWSFRTLEARYRLDPAEYRFRSRLEALERGLAGRHFTIVDARILRDGGGLWLNQ